MIDFSKYAGGYLYVFRCDDGLYDYELPVEKGSYTFSNPIPFEDLPQGIQERVAILMTAPEDVAIKGVGKRTTNDNFILKDN